MTSDPSRWSQPFAALLGAYDAQIGYGLPSIGGKDSMSGTFEHIDVPPTLVSFAVDTGNLKNIITPEIKEAGNYIILFEIERDEYDIPVYESVLELYAGLHNLISENYVRSAYSVDSYGIASALSHMAFGNKLGVTIDADMDASRLFKNGLGNIICEIEPGAKPHLDELDLDYTIIGTVNDKSAFVCGDATISVDEAIECWKKPLNGVFPYTAVDDKTPLKDSVFRGSDIHICKNKVARPKVFIPVFPGTNCEYDSAKAFERAGADVDVRIFKNLNAQDIADSVLSFTDGIRDAQIIMFPGGFSAGDEPDGSAKFFATAFRNDHIREAVMDLVNTRDGLVLGICNGFQALIKLGLVPYGEIRPQTADSPTLTYNTIGRHISKMVYTKVVSDKSPWLKGAELGKTYVSPASHGEGRFVASDEWIRRLFENGQVATQYASPEGYVSMDEETNINGSYHAIEGITSPDGRILGKMAHVERRGTGVAINIYGEQDLRIFESGVEYFR